MPNFASATITGHLGRDPETRQAGSSSVTSFSVAVNTGYGERKTCTWWNVSVWGKRGETAAQHLHKGDAVTISGEPALRKYESNGEERQSLDIEAHQWAFAGGKPEGQQAAPQRSAAPEPEFDDDIPFSFAIMVPVLTALAGAGYVGQAVLQVS